MSCSAISNFALHEQSSQIKQSPHADFWCCFASSVKTFYVNFTLSVLQEVQVYLIIFKVKLQPAASTVDEMTIGGSTNSSMHDKISMVMERGREGRELADAHQKHR